MSHSKTYLRSFVRSELLSPWSVDPCVLEGEAEAAHERATLLYPFAGSELLAKGHGFACVELQGYGCGLAGLIPGVLLIRPCADTSAWNLRVLHELAHAILHKRFTFYTHADVWALTLMLACPRSAFRHIAHADHVPAWALDLRRETARRVPRAA